MFYRPADKRRCLGNSCLGTRSGVSHHASAFNYSAPLAALGCPSLSSCCPQCHASTAAYLQGDEVGTDPADNPLFLFIYNSPQGGISSSVASPRWPSTSRCPRAGRVEPSWVVADFALERMSPVPCGWRGHLRWLSYLCSLGLDCSGTACPSAGFAVGCHVQCQI